MQDKHRRERVHLVQSELHLAQARRIVLQQEQLIEHLAASGHDTRDANSFLSALTEALHCFEHHHRIILDRLTT
jgi:hypothetical protein